MTTRYRQLYDRLIADIDTIYQPGDRFPTQRELMQQHRVGYNTVGRAMEMLVAEGLLERHQGRGSFVAARRAPTTRVVGVLVPDVANPFYAPIVNAALSAAHARGFHAIVHSTGNQVAGEDAALNRLIREDAIAGLLLCPVDRRCQSPFMRRLRRRRFPCVLFPSVDFAAAAAWDFVATDDEHGAWLATEHLIAKGCRRIAFVSPGDADDPRVANRLGGHLRALRQHDLPFDPSRWFQVDDLERIAGHQAAGLIHRHGDIDGIFAANDLLAIGVLLGLRERGVRVGGRGIRLVGFDDHDLAAWPDIDLSTLRQDRHRIGSAAMDLLLDRCQGREPPAHQIILTPTLIERGSSR